MTGIGWMYDLNQRGASGGISSVVSIIIIRCYYRVRVKVIGSEGSAGQDIGGPFFTYSKVNNGVLLIDSVSFQSIISSSNFKKMIIGTIIKERRQLSITCFEKSDLFCLLNITLPE